MNWFALGKIVSSHGQSPGPASGITYSIVYNDPTSGAIETPPIRPWNPLEFDPNGEEIEVVALLPQSPILVINVAGILHFVALGPAEPRSYFECGSNLDRGGFVPIDPVTKKPVRPPPPRQSSPTAVSATASGPSEGA
jgi:hypothetical protein